MHCTCIRNRRAWTRNFHLSLTRQWDKGNFYKKEMKAKNQTYYARRVHEYAEIINFQTLMPYCKCFLANNTLKT